MKVVKMDPLNSVIIYLIHLFRNHLRSAGTALLSIEYIPEQNSVRNI
jgi:hypothetical protein